MVNSLSHVGIFYSRLHDSKCIACNSTVIFTKIKRKTNRTRVCTNKKHFVGYSPAPCYRIEQWKCKQQMKFEFKGANIVGTGSLALLLHSFEIHIPSSQRPSFYAWRTGVGVQKEGRGPPCISTSQALAILVVFNWGQLKCQQEIYLFNSFQQLHYKTRQGREQKARCPLYKLLNLSTWLNSTRSFSNASPVQKIRFYITCQWSSWSQLFRFVSIFALHI